VSLQTRSKFSKFIGLSMAKHKKFPAGFKKPKPQPKRKLSMAKHKKFPAGFKKPKSQPKRKPKKPKKK